MLRKHLGGHFFRHFQRELQLRRRGGEQFLPVFRRRELVEREVAADDGKRLGIFRQALRFKALLRETCRASGSVRACRSGPASPDISRNWSRSRYSRAASARRRRCQTRARSKDDGGSKSGSVTAGARGTVVERIGAGFDDAARQHADHHRSGAVVVARHDLDLVPARRQVRRHRLRNALIQQQIAALPGVIVEARNQMPRLKRGASMAFCAFMPKSITLNITCSSACS